MVEEGRRKERGQQDGNRQKKREADEADRVMIAPGATAEELRRFRAALFWQFPGSPTGAGETRDIRIFGG